MASGKHALVFGASGISGWAIVKNALTYPTPTTFARVTGLTNRPLSIKDARLPTDDKRLQLVDEVDLSSSPGDVADLLREAVPDISTVTHVFFTAYVHTTDFFTLKIVNSDFIRVAVLAATEVSSNIEAVILQTGGKAYGFEFPSKVAINPPLKESLPRIPEPEASNIFYYPQYDILEEMAKGQPWTFSEVRPDAIIGFVPGTNAMNLAQGIAIFLSLHRQLHGAGAAVPFPGSQKSYHATHTDVSQDQLARFEIHVALNRGACAPGSIFNIADGPVVSWAQLWPGLCAYFGLTAADPEDHHAHHHAPGEAVDHTHGVKEFVLAHIDAWRTLVRAQGLQPEAAQRQNWAHVDMMMGTFDFDRAYDLGRAREVGFADTVDTLKGYETAFARMRDANVIP